MEYGRFITPVCTCVSPDRWPACFECAMAIYMRQDFTPLILDVQ